MYDGSLTTKNARAAGRGSVSRSTFSITEARIGLRQCLAGSRKSELQMFAAIKDAGVWWTRICEWCDDRAQHGGQRISAMQWAGDNAPISKQWLDAHAQFASDWPEFLVAWKWASDKSYAPMRRPSLRSAQILLELKRRDDTHQSAIAKRTTPVRVRPAPELILPPSERIILNPTQTLLHGDIVEMAKTYIADESLDLIFADGPYNMPMDAEPSRTDELYDLYGINPRFRQPWDSFADVDEFADLSEAWLKQAIRCLHERGSLFVCCSYHSIGPICYLLQKAKINFVQHIQVYQASQRPVLTKRTLQYSHFTIIWATKHPTKYRFDYDACKWGHWPKDQMNNIPGQMLRDVWNINASGAENTTKFPSQKRLAVYERILTMCGKAGGTFGDFFSGSGTGAVAALRYGMKSISIEREARYVPDIVARVQREMKRKRD
jgi:site-specific DNA-methyltransferase (adenine-specific)